MADSGGDSPPQTYYYTAETTESQSKPQSFFYFVWKRCGKDRISGCPTWI